MARTLIDMRRMKEKCGGVHHTTIYNWMDSGLLPRSITLGGRVLWDEAEVDAYLDRKFAEREGEEAA